MEIWLFQYKKLHKQPNLHESFETWQIIHATYFIPTAVRQPRFVSWIWCLVLKPNAASQKKHELTVVKISLGATSKKLTA